MKISDEEALLRQYSSCQSLEDIRALAKRYNLSRGQLWNIASKYNARTGIDYTPRQLR